MSTADRYEVTIHWRGNTKRRVFRGDVGWSTATTWINECQAAQGGKCHIEVLKNHKPWQPPVEEVGDGPTQYYKARNKWSSFDPAESKNAIQKGEFVGWVVRAPLNENDTDDDTPLDPTQDDDSRPKLVYMGIMIEYTRSREEYGNFTLPGARFFINLKKGTVTDKPKPSFARYNDDSIIMDGAWPKVEEVHIKSHRTNPLQNHRFGPFLKQFAEEIKQAYDEAWEKRKQRKSFRRAM